MFGLENNAQVHSLDVETMYSRICSAMLYGNERVNIFFRLTTVKWACIASFHSYRIYVRIVCWSLLIFQNCYL